MYREEEGAMACSRTTQESTWRNIWRAMREALPTRATLFRRKSYPDPTCPTCREEEESVEHTLLFCNHAKMSWFGCRLGLKPKREGFPDFQR